MTSAINDPMRGYDEEMGENIPWYAIDGHHIRDDGEERWYKDGMLHRDNGPAIIWANGTEGWFQYDMHHREDGPAIVSTVNEHEYYIYDRLCSFKKWANHFKISEKEQAILLLKYGKGI